MMTHEDIRSLLGVYALDAIDDPDERHEVELHLEECGECRAEVDSHRAVAVVMAEAELEAPPTLWNRIEGGLGDEPRTSARQRFRFERIVSIAAVAALVAAVGMAVLWADAAGEVGNLRDRITELEANAADTQLALEDARSALEADPVETAIERARSTGTALEVDVAGDIGTGTAVVLPDGQGWLTDLSYEALDASLTYQLWAIQDGAVISAGVLGSNPETVSFHVDADRLDGLVITVEDAGGVVSSSNAAAAAWLADA